MTSGAASPSRRAVHAALHPLFLISALYALSYAIFAPAMFEHDGPTIGLAAFKAGPVLLLAALATYSRSILLGVGLLLGSIGDALLVWQSTFVLGAVAFLAGHLCYITLFVRNGVGVRAALADRTRVSLLAVTVLAALAASQMTPHDSPMMVPLSIYSGVLTLMLLSSYTLPWTRWVAIAGAVLFFISDGFVAWNTFHHDPDPALAFWRSFAGWMIYWAGQAALCIGAQGLHQHARHP